MKLVGLDMFVEVFLECEIFRRVKECPVNDLVTLPFELTRIICAFDIR